MELPEGFEFNSKEVFRYGPKKVKWIIGSEWSFKGNNYQKAWYGDWSEDLRGVWTSWGDKKQSTAFMEKEREVTKEIKNTVEVEATKKNQACAEEWRKEWPLISEPMNLHPYIEAKGLSDNYGAKIDFNNTLLIKIEDETGIVGVQKIYKSANGFEKRFSTGIKKKGSFGYIGNFRESEFLYLAEGFATAASIYEATGIPVIMGVDAGNLFNVIQTVRKILPRSKIIICADDDKNKVGIKAANHCKSSFLNIIVRMPKFTLKADDLTDFNDLHKHEGIMMVTEQLKFAEDEFVKITALGHLDDQYFYTSSINSQIVSFSASSHVDKSFFRLAPFEYWKRFSGGEGDKVSWPWVASKMINDCHERGLFNPENVRGRGAWIDQGKFVINNGQDTPGNSSYHYQKLLKVDYDTKDPYNDNEMNDLLNAFKKLVLKNPNEYIYLAAWLVQAQIFACLPWRFHLWLTGEKGSGKSHVIKWMSNSLPLSVLTNNATVAGIRQGIQNDATPICFDETEPDSGRMDGILELARQMSSNDGAKTLRGSSQGKAINLNTQCIFLFGSIQVQQLNSADTSRIFVVEMDKTKNQPIEDYQYIEHEFTKASVNRSRIFARAFQSLSSITESFGVSRAILMNNGLEARQADQLSSAIACFHVYKSTRPITPEQCEAYIEEFGFIKSDYVEENGDSDSSQCYRALMSMELDKGMPLSTALEIIKKNPKDEYWARFLTVNLMRYYPDRNELFIAAKNPKLSSKLISFRDFASILRRDKMLAVPGPDGKLVRKVRINGLGGMISGLVLKTIPEIS